jgi:hypothetical protein
MLKAQASHGRKYVDDDKNMLLVNEEDRDHRISQLIIFHSELICPPLLEQTTSCTHIFSKTKA